MPADARSGGSALQGGEAAALVAVAGPDGARWLVGVLSSKGGTGCLGSSVRGAAETFGAERTGCEASAGSFVHAGDKSFV